MILNWRQHMQLQLRKHLRLHLELGIGKGLKSSLNYKVALFIHFLKEDMLQSSPSWQCFNSFEQ